VRGIFLEGYLPAGSVLCHVAGPSGGGKTTLMHSIQSDNDLVGRVSCEDMDEFDEDARKALSQTGWSKNHWTDSDFRRHAAKKQEIMDAWIAKKRAKGRLVVLVGFHTEDGNFLRIPTNNRFMLDTGPLKAAVRAHIRDVPGGYREPLRLYDYYKHNVNDIEELRRLGYQPRTPEWILGWIRSRAR
jgi:hypothetical protein